MSRGELLHMDTVATAIYKQACPDVFLLNRMSRLRAACDLWTIVSMIQLEIAVGK